MMQTKQQTNTTQSAPARPASVKLGDVAELTESVAWLTDMDRIIRWISPNVRTLTGRAPDACAGRHISQTFTEPGDGTILQELMDEVMAAVMDGAGADGRQLSAVNRRGVLRIRTSGSSERWIECSIKPALDVSGRIAGLLGSVRDITAIRRSEVAAEFLEFAVDHSRCGLVWMQEDGEILHANAVLCDLLGYTDQELFGRNISEFDERGKAGDWAALWRLFLHEGHTDYDTTFTARDGQALPVEITGERMSKGSSTFVCFFVGERDEGVARTDLRALRRTEALLEHCPDLICTLDAGGTILYINHDMAGMSREEMIGRNAFDILPNEYVGVGRQMLERSFTGTMSEDQEITLFGSNHYSYRMIPMTHEDGIESVMLIATDITLKRVTEQALRVSQERYELAMRGAKDGLWDWDIESQTIFYSPRWKSMLGYEEDEISSSPFEWFDRIHADDKESLKQAIDRHLNGEDEYFEHECRVMHKEGSYHWMLYRGLSVANDRGRVYRMSGSQTDITGRKRAEAELHKKEEALRLSMRMEAVTRLAGGVAHDYNNVLSIILGYSRLLLNDMDPADPARHDLDEIRIAGERAAAVTRQLMAFSRTQVMQPRVLRLGDELEESKKMLDRLAGDHIDVIIESDLKDECISADPEQLQQILLNLIVNSREAMPRGGEIRIILNLVDLTAELCADWLYEVKFGEYVRMTVSDTGVGMDEEIARRVFEPFFTTKEHGRGDGMGLSSVYGIVKQSGGYIQVRSEPGKGAHFDIYLPRVHAPVITPEARERQDTHNPENFRILLAEDDEMLRHMFGKVLRKKGYEIVSARDGQEALRLFEEARAPFDLLLTDVGMPNMDGPELVSAISPLQPDLGIVFMSGYTDETISHLLGADSPNEYLQKPISPDTLLRKVNEVLDRKIRARMERAEKEKAACGKESESAKGSRPDTPPALKGVFERIARLRSDEESVAEYHKHRDAVLAHCAANPGDGPLRSDLAHFHMLVGEADAAVAAARAWRNLCPSERDAHYRLYNHLVEAFPDCVEVRTDRAQIAIGLGCLDVARQDLDYVSRCS